MNHDFLWVEKYRPKTIADCILPKELKLTLENLSKSVPNMIFSGPSGCGKTTAARAIVNQIDGDLLFINASEKRNIDTLRSDIANFASTKSITGGQKVVILDEADYLNRESTQPALRSFMENYSENCRFILTVNFPAKLMDALISRMTNVDFGSGFINGFNELGPKYFKRLSNILDHEGIKYEKNLLARVVKEYYPDFRKVLMEIQGYIDNGELQSSILSMENNLDELIKMLQNDDFNGYRAWVAKNIGNHSPRNLFRSIYDRADEFMEKDSVPALILIIGEYQFKAGFVVDQEINMVSALTEICLQCKMKKK